MSQSAPFVGPEGVHASAEWVILLEHLWYMLKHTVNVIENDNSSEYPLNFVCLGMRPMRIRTDIILAACRIHNKLYSIWSFVRPSLSVNFYSKMKIARLISLYRYLLHCFSKRPLVSQINCSFRGFAGRNPDSSFYWKYISIYNCRLYQPRDCEWV